jgi:hypothetical protein
LYFKPHPNLPGSFIDEFKHFSNRIIFVEKGSIQNWLLRCSNFICAQSISSIESVICKNKTMVHITKGNKIPAIVHSDSVLLSTTPEELKQNFNKNNPLTQKIYESFVNSSDSLRNIFSVIERKCHGKSKSI